MSDESSELLALLPRGEWADVRSVGDPEGMMAARGTALFAEARALRLGGVPAFIKFYRGAPANAGDSTKGLTPPDRLRRVRERIERVAEDSSVPLVPVIGVQQPRPEVLIVAMEKVEVLHDLITKGRSSVSVALAVLETLAPPTDAAWHHFDICPKNVGLSRTGDVYLIDPESLYTLTESERIAISAPHLKGFRLPRWLYMKLGEHLAKSTELPAGLAIIKQRIEVALLAAEVLLCELAAAPPGHYLDDWLPGWLDKRLADSPDLAVVWRSGLLEPLLSQEGPDLDSLAEAIREARPDPAEVDSARPAAAVHNLGADRGKLERAQLLRADLLTPGEVEEYRSQLEVETRAGRGAGAWRELIFVAICYVKDPRYALRVARDAVKQCPEDDELANQCKMVELWGKRS